jgi:hypothetical protein
VHPLATATQGSGGGVPRPAVRSPLRKLELLKRLHGARALRTLGRLHHSLVYVEKAYGAGSAPRPKFAAMSMGTSKGNLFATPVVGAGTAARFDVGGVRRALPVLRGGGCGASAVAARLPHSCCCLFVCLVACAACGLRLAGSKAHFFEIGGAEACSSWAPPLVRARMYLCVLPFTSTGRGAGVFVPVPKRYASVNALAVFLRRHGIGTAPGEHPVVYRFLQVRRGR